MRQVYLNLILIAILIVLWSQLDSPAVFSLAPTVEPSPTVTSTPTPTQAPPQMLIIPKLTLNANIEPVGVNEGRQMAIPSDFSQIGWYVRGIKPGEEGTAILAGHFDDQSGQPAAFYNLNQLEVGDRMEVIDIGGKQLKFIVDDKQAYPAFTAIEELTNTNKGKNLILITCSGWWDSSIASYSHRLVVFATLQ